MYLDTIYKRIYCEAVIQLSFCTDFTPICNRYQEIPRHRQTASHLFVDFILLIYEKMCVIILEHMSQ